MLSSLYNVSSGSVGRVRALPPVAVLRWYSSDYCTLCGTRYAKNTHARTNTNDGEIRPLWLLGIRRNLDCRLQRPSSGITWDSYVLGIL